MSKIIWDSSLELDIPPIDKQHKRIVDYINQLEEIKQTHDRSVIGDVLNQLVDYTMSHFAFEEELMEESGYIFVNAHKRVHNLFVRKVNQYMERFRLNEDITEELLISLRTWLVNHIQNDDRDYGKTVREKTVDVVSKNKSWFKRLFS